MPENVQSAANSPQESYRHNTIAFRAECSRLAPATDPEAEHWRSVAPWPPKHTVNIVLKTKIRGPDLPRIRSMKGTIFNEHRRDKRQVPRLHLLCRTQILEVLTSWHSDLGTFMKALVHWSIVFKLVTSLAKLISVYLKQPSACSTNCWAKRVMTWIA